MPRLLSTFLLLCCYTLATAQIRLPAVISSNMVLQRNTTVQLWGWAHAGEKIRVHTSWNNAMDSTITTRDAKWRISIKTPEAGGPYTISLQGSNLVKLENVLIGEVWVCSGQSNMAWSSYQGLKDVIAEFPTCKDNNIRFFQIPNTTATSPQDDCSANWVACDSNTLRGFSAVGYFFGKKLRQDLNVPIGLINTSWGGTPAEVWTPAPEVEKDAALKEAAGKLKPTDWWPYMPGYTYNAMIAPVTNFNIAGAIWYQGESNTNTASTYTKLMGTMIGAWRKAWNKELPFYFVQIAPYNYGQGNIIGALLREAQTAILKFPRTGMAVITDLVADTANIHPTNKHDVGLRLANWALAETYGKTGITYKSPQFSRMEIKDNKIILHFDHAEDGLMLKGKKAEQFFIAGADHQFIPADVMVKGNTLTVSAKTLKQPEAVRFAFTNTAIGNIFNKAGLPVNPFRTDNWEK